MPRTVDEIIEAADQLAARFEDHQPDPDNLTDATALRSVRQAFTGRAEAERHLADTIADARSEGHSWASIGAMLGTSGEAARQKNGQPAQKP